MNDSFSQSIAEKMNLEEKIRLMSGDTTLQQVVEEKRNGYHFNFRPYEAGGNDKYGIPKLKFCDGPRGVVCGYGQATCFPVPILRGAAFDSELEEKIGQAIGKEILAFGGNFFGGVCINLPYHPGWGRSQETYGEDSFLLGKMGAALVRGVQSEGVIACLKHFAFNSIENSRFEVSISCDKRTEREVYLPHFKDCVDAGAAAVMTAFNRYQGIPCGHSEYLLHRILREEWGFNGIVISDFFWGISDTVLAAKGGVDVEMCHTRYYGDRLGQAVQEGSVSREVIDDAALRIIRIMTSFEKTAEQKHQSPELEIIGCEAHKKLALQAAQEGITLIKNEGNVLPLKKNARKIAVIGKLASKVNIGDQGSSSVYPKYVVTLLEGIVKAAKDTEIIYYDGLNQNHIRRIVKEVDAVIYVVGLDYCDEGEYDPIKESERKGKKGGDRKSLYLHAEERAMLQDLGRINTASIAVLMGGGTILVSDWEKNIPAIVHAYYPGQEGGTALAQILFGEINPSGKLPFVLPKTEADLPSLDWEAKEQYYEYYHGYHRLDKLGKEPYRPFGFGLSYTKFELSDYEVQFTGKEIEASVTLKNIGEIAGAEVVQLYVGFQNSRYDRPVKSLYGFERTYLCAGENKRIQITCPIDKIKYYNVETNEFELEHMEYEVSVGCSSADLDLQKKYITI